MSEEVGCVENEEEEERFGEGGRSHEVTCHFNSIYDLDERL
jgi:hypothetical protein